MSLVRAFTRRGVKTPEVDNNMSSPRGNLTTKRSFAPGRPRISAPLELISTTNMLSYNAPSIFPSSSSASSSHSDTDSERSSSEASSPPSSPEPSNGSSPKENHLSCYFGAPSRQSNTGIEAPVIPKRAPSHNKKDSLARSMLRISSGTSKTAYTTSTARSSINMFTPNPETIDTHSHSHSSGIGSPFDSELAQVSEIAEEYGIDAEQLAVVDEEEQELICQGFSRFRAEDYMSEIQGLFVTAFGDVQPAISSIWI